MSISVALAARNGARFIKQQVDSIVPQLTADDELLISLDPSSDATAALVEELAREIAQLKVIQGPGRGVTANFECALSACTGDFIFLCDHDDVWYPDKVRKVMECFERTAACLVLHDAEVVDENLDCISPSFFELRGSRPGYGHNIAKNSYMGCCMAFRRELLPAVLPFPEDIPMFDQWIGLIAEKRAAVRFLPEPLIKYRRHGANATSGTHSGPVQMVKWRRTLVRELNKRLKELSE